MLPTAVLFVFIISIGVEVYSQSANTPNLKPSGTNVCSDSQTVSDWILEAPSRLKSNEKPLNKTVEGAFGLHDLEEERPNRRNRIVLMRFRGRGRGRRRTRASKIAPESEYRLDLVNKFTKNAEVLFVAHYMNRTECGMGTFTPYEENPATKPDNIKRKDNCFWSIESSLLLKGKQHFKYITPKCGCFDFSYYIAYKPGDDTVIERPDPTSLDPVKKLTKMYCISERQGTKFSKKSRHKKKNRFRGKKGKKQGRKEEKMRKVLSRSRKDIGLSEGKTAPLFYSRYSPHRKQILYDDVEEIHSNIKKDEIENSMKHYEYFGHDGFSSSSENDDDVGEVEEREQEDENEDHKISVDDSEENDDSGDEMKEEDDERKEIDEVEGKDKFIELSEIETNKISEENQLGKQHKLDVGLGDKESGESSEEDATRERMNGLSEDVNQEDDIAEKHKENNEESNEEQNDIEIDDQLKEDEKSEETDKSIEDENIEDETNSNEIIEENNNEEDSEKEKNKSCESDESEENSNEDEDKKIAINKKITKLNELENENNSESKEDKENEDSNDQKIGYRIFHRISERERRIREEEKRRRPFKLRMDNRRRIFNERRRTPNHHKGNLRASQLCCNQGIYRKKLILHNTLENIVEFTETCEDVPHGLVLRVSRTFYVPGEFCIHRFTQCCHTWSLISPRMRRGRHHRQLPPI